MATPNSLWMALFLLGTLGVPPALAWASEGHNFREKEVRPPAGPLGSGSVEGGARPGLSPGKRTDRPRLPHPGKETGPTPSSGEARVTAVTRYPQTRRHPACLPSKQSPSELRVLGEAGTELGRPPGGRRRQGGAGGPQTPVDAALGPPAALPFPGASSVVDISGHPPGPQTAQCPELPLHEELGWGRTGHGTWRAGAPPRRPAGPWLTGGRPQFLGHWFAVGMVSNASWFREKKDILSMCVAMVAQAKPERKDGVLTLTTGFLRWGGGRASGLRAPPGPGLPPWLAAGQDPHA